MMMRILRPFRALVVLALALAAVVDPAVAQPVAFDTTFFAGLSYRSVGPVRGGRSIAVSGSDSRPLEYYFGATGGGLWKTTDAGTTWRPVTDGQINSSSVGAIGQCAADPDVVYIGMGEVQLRGNIMQGDGVYKSTDGGQKWTHAGLPESQAIARIRVHPTDCDLVYAAVLGHPYGPHPERGVYRSTDGGETWQKVLYRSDKAGAVDLVMDPSNPDVLYAGLWEVYRTSWGMYSGGEGSGLFKSADGGANWTELTRNEGLPEGMWGKIGVSVSGADPNRVYAIIEADSGGVFRSDDAGVTWTRTNVDRRLRQRAFYYTRIYADPVERDIVYVLNVSFHKSTDGGETFPTTIRPPHGDNHDMWIASNDNQRMIEGNDGGGNVSWNGGQTWTEQDYPTAQLYHITTTSHVPYWVCGAQQDNSTACMASNGWRQMADNVSVGGGESGYIANDPENPNIFYAGSYGGLMTRFDYATGESERINVWPENPMGHSSEDIRERFQWTYPIVFSRTGPKRLYTGSQHLWMTTTEGMSWERISPDLTRADPSTLGPSGGPITKDQTGVETYGTIFTIAPSQHDANTVWTGSDDGYVQVTRDHGRTWKNVTPPDIPEFARISLIEISPHRPGTAYIAAKRYQLDDRQPYIYRTDDYGESWVKTVNGIADGHFVHAVREDIVRPEMLFAGTEHGVYISFDNGAQWQPFNRNLPDVQVPNLMLKGSDLVIATHGRSAYIMDNISALRQLNAEIVASNVHLFDPADARRGLDDGLPITYQLDEPATRVTIDIIDAGGNVVRNYTGTRQAAGPGGGRVGEEVDDPEEGRRGGGGGARVQTDAGTNRFTWDMRHEGATTFPGMIMWSAGSNGPQVLPGMYTVRLQVDDEDAQTQAFEVGMDPRMVDVTMDDLKRQFDLAVQVRDRTSQANQAVIDVRKIYAEIEDRVGKDASVGTQAEQLSGKLGAVEQELYQVRNQSNQDPLNYPIKLNNKLAALQGAVEGVHGAPTEQTYTVFTELSQRLDVQIEALNQVIIVDLAAFNRLLESKNLQPIADPRARPITD